MINLHGGRIRHKSNHHHHHQEYNSLPNERIHEHIHTDTIGKKEWDCQIEKKNKARTQKEKENLMCVVTWEKFSKSEKIVKQQIINIKETKQIKKAKKKIADITEKQ